MYSAALRSLILITSLLVPFGLSAAQNILLLGDSLSAGYGLKQEQSWVNLLQDKYEKQGKTITLINASISGETSGGALRRLPGLLKEHAPSHVLIELGGNDGLRGFPLHKLETNLTELIALSKKAGADVALMQIQIPPNYGPRYTKAFTGLYDKVSAKTGVTLMPFFVAEVAVVPGLMQNDNIHPNGQAQPRLSEIMQGLISAWLSAKVQDNSLK